LSTAKASASTSVSTSVTTSAGHIVFSHANGFPAGTYRLIFDAWRAAGWQVHAVEKFGHDPRHPVTSNWPHVRDELIGFIERDVDVATHGAPFLIGHSLGGFLSVLAASKRPDLARGVVLLDSPIVAGWRAGTLRFAKATGIGERYSPGFVSKRRRQHWPNADAAFKHFAGKTAFARWQPEVLRDYITAGTEPDPAHGQTLVFRRDVETAIYNTLPHHMGNLLRRHPVRCPVAFVGGSESDEVRIVGLKATHRLTQGRMSTVEGSHLYPFERPGETAAEVLTWLARLQASEGTRL